MATILLSAAGAAIGSGFGGTVLGLSGAVIGRAIGATLGRVIDQRALSGGSAPVESGKVERFRLAGAGEGAAIPRLWGRMRLPGQVIWASRFAESVATSGGGKGIGGGGGSQTRTYSYTVSLAIALCEGEVQRLGRVWADGKEIDLESLPYRFYPGTETQLPDPRIMAIEGADHAPAYRGIAYVVFEDLDLTPYGSRVPQFNFELIRNTRPEADAPHLPMSDLLPGVCVIPGTGEYSLATTPVRFELAPGQSVSTNVHTPGERTDFSVSLDHLRGELPSASGASLVVSWFGDDLRCGSCTIRPKVEQAARDGAEMPWRVSGLTRTTAGVLPQLGGGPVYGGTPTDQSVIEAITALRAKGLAVTFYPFILMAQMVGNSLPNPYGGPAGQPALPWRGRITTALAPGQSGTSDRSAAAAAEVAAFFGTASASDFAVVGGEVVYSGPSEWGLRRFILHYAKLCQLAGGVDAFLIGSELRGLTQIRGAGDSFPAVQALISLAAEVRSILGPATRISYAADWSEYFGYQADGNRYFHLDPLWADANIDFVGIDNYLPISDWRGTSDEADADFGGPHDLNYLKANIAGGEGFDWYYEGPAGRLSQSRQPIQDLADGEHWIYRPKDLRGWWENPHHDRIGGVRQAAPSPWVPMSKPFRFTEFGCAAIDKGANEPNKFLDPKSSESGLPAFSTGLRDDLAQMSYFRAMQEFWTDPARNPVSPIYSASMLDWGNSHAWAWDARPFPAFPARDDLWSDFTSYEAGHWLNGRASNQPLSSVIREIASAAGLASVDADRAHGLVRGYAITQIQDARAALQPLMQANGLDAAEREGQLTFFSRRGTPGLELTLQDLAKGEDPALQALRGAPASLPGHVMLTYYQAESDFPAKVASALFPGLDSDQVRGEDLPLLLLETEARSIAERWLAESQQGRESVTLELPLSRVGLGLGEVLRLEGRDFRADRIEVTDRLKIEATATDLRLHAPPRVAPPDAPAPRRLAAVNAPQPVYPVLMDLPLMTGEEVPHAPHVAVASTPWQGDVGVWASATTSGFGLNRLLTRGAMLGLTETTLPRARTDLWDMGPALRVRFAAGSLASASDAAVLSGANLLAIGDGSPANWELIQFASANLVAPGTYDLSRRLRGLQGSEALMPASWPVGSLVVVLDGSAQQLDLPLALRGTERNYRFAPASRGPDAPSAVARTASFLGEGLRPYAPCHLQLASLGLDRVFGWTRRSRIAGDSWLGTDIPLGEETEAYLVQIRQGASLVRSATLSSPAFTYTGAMQAIDGASGSLTLQVAQISALYGPGPFSELSFTL